MHSIFLFLSHLSSLSFHVVLATKLHHNVNKSLVMMLVVGNVEVVDIKWSDLDNILFSTG